MEQTEKGKVVSVYIEDEMKKSYIDYAMSVIVGRALPDVRDGLKPVHRRILFGMKERGWTHERPYVKSAKIVGEVIGNYHPHGDVAVYDSMVRMVQDFSLRYPLIDGQGNFGCFTKDTKLRLSDGRNLNFEELINEVAQGKRNYTFTFNPAKKRIEIAQIKKPRLTRKKVKIIKVILNNGQEIKCTPDHLFMLRDGTYRKAKELKLNDSLMPLYTKLYDGKDDPNLKGYEILYQPLKNTWEFAHHLADEWNLENEAYKKNAGKKIAFGDDLRRFSPPPDALFREAKQQGTDHFLAKDSLVPAVLLRYAKQQGIGKFYLCPSGYTFLCSKIRHHKDFNKLNNNPDNIQRIQWNQHWQLHREITEWRHKNDPEYTKKISEARKFFWADPINRMRQSKILSKKNKENRQNPEFRTRFINGVIKSRQRQLQENPCLMQELTQRAKIVLKEKRKDPLYKQRVIRSKILGFVNHLLKTERRLTPQLYEEKRTSGVPKMETALRYFNNFDELIHSAAPNPALKGGVQERRSVSTLSKPQAKAWGTSNGLIIRAKQGYNHKIIKIEIIDEKEDVYDLTVEPWHNFALASGVFVHNSIDGDPPAAYRYTEARLASLSGEMLRDIDKDTVDFVPTFDGSMEEPVVLPSAIPNLLVNGSSGIAVGMATNIPPHNLSEVIDGLMLMIDNPQVEINEIMKIIKAPDFPQGAIIFGRQGVKDAYLTGRGSIKLRAKADIEEMSSNREAIIVREMPYQVNKAQLMETIAELVRDKKLEGISDLRDESDRDGTRMVIELKRDANAQIILNQLFNHTQLEVSFGVIMLALVDNAPKVLNLREILYHYIEHRQVVVTRRTRYELAKAEARAHILEGLKIALDNLNKVIKVIRDSANVETARLALMKNFNLSKEQAQAILEMKLQQLTGLEREKIEAEYLELIKRIAMLKSILDDPKKLMAIIKDELLKIKEKYGDTRRTKIVAQAVELDIEDLIKEEDVAVTISHSGYIKRLPATTYRSQHRGGKGITGVVTKEEDFVEDIFVTSTHNYMLFFSNLGRVYWLKVYEIPEASRQSKGKAIVNLIQLSSQEERINAAISVRDFINPDAHLLMATKKGVIKKTPLTEYSNPRKGGIISINLEEGDSLIAVKVTDGKEEVVIGTKKGIAIHFKEEEVRSIGRTGMGVRGIRLEDGDEVVGMEVVRGKEKFLTATENGFGKITGSDKYRLQSRGGKGVINIKANERNGLVIGIKRVSDKDDIVLMTAKGVVIRQPVKDISVIGRNTVGVRLIRLEPGDKLVSISRISTEDVEEENKETENKTNNK